MDLYGRVRRACHVETNVIGVAAVQKIDAIATELYSGYRYHEDGAVDGPDLDPINAVLTGARIKF